MSKCCDHEHEHEHEEEEINKTNVILTILGTIIFIAAIFLNTLNETSTTILYIISYILIGYDIVFKAISHLFKKDMFDENFLMVVATFGAFAISEYKEAIAVILLYKIGEFLQDKAVENSKKKITETIDIREKTANLKTSNGVKKVETKELKIKDIIIVKTGEKIPVDGVLKTDNAKLDMSFLTGESKPVSKNINEEILSGAINIGGVIEVEVSKTYENSTVYKIIEMIEEANEKKSTTEKFITKFAKVYTPIVTFIAVIIAFLPLVTNYTYSESLHKAFTFLVISCPCALVISVPLSFFVGIGVCSKKGILVKGSNYLDNITLVDTVVFDKTGTLTKGVFEVTKVESVGNLSKDEVVEYIAKCEYYSNHYIAKSILDYYNKKIDESDIISHEEIAGKGIKANLKGKEIMVGNYTLMEESGLDLERKEEVGTIVYLSVDNNFEGYIVLSDVIKEDALNLVKDLQKNGVKDVVMLTGDEKFIANEVAKKLGIEKVHSKLLPKDKSDILENLKNNQEKKVAFVGDGINDAPVLAMADIGISMGKGADIAIETSDIAIMSDEPSKVVDILKISRKTKKIVKQNIIFALSIKVIFLVCSILFTVPMWFAIFADVGVALITIINALRIFNIKF